MRPFAHLHVHTEYSLLDGLSRIKNLVSYTKELGMDSVAITDHGAMYGVIEFYRACKAEGVKPIIGLETYLAPRGMRDRDPQLDKKPYHLLLLAENQTGYNNLLRIASASQLEGYYYRPRIDKEFLAEHSEGLICTSGCLAAEIPQMLMQGREEAAKEQLGWFTDVFGRGSFFIELQHHDIPELHRVNEQLYELGPYADLQFLATNDVHYVRREDAETHDVLLCIQTGALQSEQNRMRFSGDSYYMRSPEEMWQIFGQVPESLENTVRVAERCEVDLDDRSYKLPPFPVPEGHDAHSYLRELCLQGLVWRYADRADSHEVRERMERELHIIHNMGFDTYFLIVWDLCEFARSEDIWWNVRGSAAGSLVAYVLGITGIDPLQNNLLFERFLNPGRVSMPDIDLDYPDDRRAELIQYCVEKYGEEKVAQIITFGTLGARAAVRDVGRTLDIDLTEIDRLARTIPAIPGKPVSLRQMLDDPENPEYREFHELYHDKNYLRRVVDTAVKLEGITRHPSTHAAGVLVADRPLIEYVPLNRPTSSSGDGLNTLSQWPMEIVESIGLLKVDFLGLRTLTIMRKACELIERYHGIHYDLETIPYRHYLPAQTQEEEEHNRQLDEAFKLLSRGETGGVFQVEGEGMTNTVMSMKPSRFEHIIAVISLFRPGPMEYIGTYIARMHGKEEVTYHHPKLEPILAETYGIIVYQEQIMQIASQLFGYDLGDADLMRRAVAKKKAKKLEEHRAIFAERGPENGVERDTALRIFDDIEFFARYGFNKSHASDYAVLTVQTAFLKAHYPHEYMAALLTLEHGDSARVSRYINECRRMNIPVEPPQLNASRYDFVIEGDPESDYRSLRFGMSAIKNVGDNSIAAILAAREAEGPFESLDDFCQRVDLRQVGKRALECLIKVGVLDDFADRPRLLASLERMMGVSTAHHKAAEVGQMSLFGEATGVEMDTGPTDDVLVDDDAVEHVPRMELLKWERELVGIYVTEHPLDKVRDQIARIVTTTSDRITDADHNRIVTMAGVITEVRGHTTKTGKPMAFAELEDQFGRISVVVWPRTWEETRELWEPNSVIFVRGRLDTEGRGAKLLAEEAFTRKEQFIAEAQLLAEEVPPEEEPPPWEAPSRTFDTPPPFEKSALEGGVQNGHNDDDPNGYTQSNGGSGDHHAHDAPENGHTNGAGYTEEDDTFEPVYTPPQKEWPGLTDAPSRERLHIKVKLVRSGDPKRDKRRLERVHGILQQSARRECEDTFSIVLVEVDSTRAVEINFDLTTCIEDAEPQLVELLGEDAVQVIEGYH